MSKKMNSRAFAHHSGLNIKEVERRILSGEYCASFKGNDWVIDVRSNGEPNGWPPLEPRYVYFFHDEAAKAIKVGMTTKITSRFDGLQVGNPSELKLMAVYGFACKRIASNVEHLAIKQFSKNGFLIRGEWFSDTINIPETMNEVMKVYSAAKKSLSNYNIYAPTVSRLELYGADKDGFFFL